MALKKWIFGTAMGEQIEAQNDNLTEIDANLDEIDIFMNNIKGISYAFIYDNTVTVGDFFNLIKNKWDDIPISTSILRFSANGYSGGGIAFKSSSANGTVLILQNGIKPLVVQIADGSWRTYNWGA